MLRSVNAHFGECMCVSENVTECMCSLLGVCAVHLCMHVCTVRLVCSVLCLCGVCMHVCGLQGLSQRAYLVF